MLNNLYSKYISKMVSQKDPKLFLDADGQSGNTLQIPQGTAQSQLWQDQLGFMIVKSVVKAPLW